MTYQEQVVATIRQRLFARFPPRDKTERKMLERNVRFFEGCTYDESEADGRTFEEIADDEIDAAGDSQ